MLFCSTVTGPPVEVVPPVEEEMSPPDVELITPFDELVVEVTL